jgi:hypothetical protein
VGPDFVLFSNTLLLHLKLFMIAYEIINYDSRAVEKPFF